MYATCLFCTRPLGRNETVESFTVGRRLAFDARRGRLWVVCPACRGWNLTPLEERWEAIEACERLFRGTRTRVSTDHIGLARVGDGMELVRIGEPLRPEFAAWRYGDRFAARRRRHVAVAAAFTAIGGVALVGGVVAGAGAVFLWQGGRAALSIAERGLPQSTIARIRAPDGALLRVRRVHVGESRFVEAGGELALSVAHEAGRTVLTGEAARQAAVVMLPSVNRFSGTREDVQLAVSRLEHAGSAEAFFAALARRGHRITSEDAPRRGWARVAVDDPTDPPPDSGLHALAPSLSLAIEMAAHEDTERRALEGELAQLEQAWRDAEEIGRISDDLLISERVARAVDRMRGR